MRLSRLVCPLVDDELVAYICSLDLTVEEDNPIRGVERRCTYVALADGWYRFRSYVLVFFIKLALVVLTAFLPRVGTVSR